MSIISNSSLTEDNGFLVLSNIGCGILGAIEGVGCITKGIGTTEGAGAIEGVGCITKGIGTTEGAGTTEGVSAGIAARSPETFPLCGKGINAV